MQTALVFLSPWIFGFLAFTLIPTLATLLFSFMDLKITDGILRHRVIKLGAGTPAPPDMTPGAHLGHEEPAEEFEHEPAEA